MTVDTKQQSWERLAGLIENQDAAGLVAAISVLPAGDLARAVTFLPADRRTQLLSLLPPELAARVIDFIPNAQAVEMLDRLAPTDAAAIAGELSSDNRADLLSEMHAADAEAILEKMAPRAAAECRQLLKYDADTAGGIMIKEYLAYAAGARVADVLDDLRENAAQYSDYDIQYAYITDDDGRLAGVLRMRDLLFTRKEAVVGEVMLKSPLSVRATATLEELGRFFDDHNFIGAPVADEHGHLVGVVRRRAVMQALEARTSNIYLKLSGIVGGEELRSMALFPRAGRRLSWLSINILLNILAASVIAAYQDTLQSVIALAVFLPIISDMSGCSGNQAVAVTMRELTLGVARPRDVLRVFLKELPIGLLNGAALGVLLGLAAVLWKGNFVFGMVVAIALAANTLVSVLVGGSIPLVLKWLRLDPALVSGPMLTTATDMCGFFFVLSIASSVLPLLPTG